MPASRAHVLALLPPKSPKTTFKADVSPPQAVVGLGASPPILPPPARECSCPSCLHGLHFLSAWLGAQGALCPCPSSYQRLTEVPRTGGGGLRKAGRLTGGGGQRKLAWWREGRGGRGRASGSGALPGRPAPALPLPVPMPAASSLPSPSPQNQTAVRGSWAGA